jgi:GT2 family glycosyltransferase
MHTTDSSAPLVILVVLNWNGFDDTNACLLSLRDLNYQNYRVMVVDNASSDDSPQRIAAAHPEVEIVRCERNLGVAGGYNVGIRAALAQRPAYVLPMNNDMECDPHFVRQMVATQQAWPGCGVVMPKVLYADAPDRINAAGAHVRWMASNIVMRGFQQRDGAAFAGDVELEFAPSYCLLLTYELAEQVSFDDAYFCYYDDWDFCLLVRKAGYRIVFSANARVWHKVSQSTKNSPKALRWWRVFGHSCVRYHRKHHSDRLLLRYVAWVVLRETLKGNLRSMPTFLGGIRTGMAASLSDDLRPTWSN